MGEIVLLSDRLPLNVPMTGRSPGVHVSTIIHNLCVSLGHYDERDSWPESKMELGCCLEYGLSQRLAITNPGRYLRWWDVEQQYWRNDHEVHRDNVYGTIDLFDIIDWAVEDVKLTWMSGRHEPDSQKLWRYWVQVKAYCFMIGSTIGRLRVGFVRGDYKSDDVYCPWWEQKFSSDELEGNWAMLMNHKDVMVEKGLLAA